MGEQEDGAAPPPRRAPGRLDTLPKIRREAAALYRDARSGRVPAVDASRLATVLGLIARVLDGAEIEARVAALEAAGRAR